MLMVDGGRGLVSPIYIDDLADAVLAAARAGRVGESYILCGPSTRLSGTKPVFKRAEIRRSTRRADFDGSNAR